MKSQMKKQKTEEITFSDSDDTIDFIRKLCWLEQINEEKLNNDKEKSKESLENSLKNQCEKTGNKEDNFLTSNEICEKNTKLVIFF